MIESFKDIIAKECKKKASELLAQISGNANVYQFFKLETTLNLIEKEFGFFKLEMIGKYSIKEDRNSQRLLQNALIANTTYCVETAMRFKQRPQKIRHTKDIKKR